MRGPPHPRDVHAIVTLFPHTELAVIVGPGLLDHLHAILDEIGEGWPYLQEDMRDPDAFRAYFFAADVMIAVVGNGDGSGATLSPLAEQDSAPGPVAIEVATLHAPVDPGMPALSVFTT